MFEFIKTFYLSLDAPLVIVIGCPIGIVLALHFASDQNRDIQGARCDSVVREARLNSVGGRSWLKSVGVVVSLLYGLYSFIYLLDRNMIVWILDRIFPY
jgi:hypothetical protein